MYYIVVDVIDVWYRI